MNTIDFTKAIKASTSLVDLYPNLIPDDLDSCIGVFAYGGNSDRYLAVGPQRFQFIAVNKDRQLAEDMAKEAMVIFQDDVLIDTVIDSHKVLHTETIQIAPIFLNKDEKERYRFSFNVDVTIQVCNA